MKKTVAIILAIVTVSLQLFCFSSCESKPLKTKYNANYFDYFDTVTVITGYTETKEEFDSICLEIEALLKEYHQLFTIYNRYEGLNNLVTVNDVKNGEHSVVKVDKKIIDMLLFAKEMYNETNGTVNIAMGSVLKIWHICRNDGIDEPWNAELPDTEKLKEASKHTDINNLIIDEENNTVFISDPKMLLDVGAIAKGYAVEKVAQYLEENGITSFIINVGGNVRTVGLNGENEPFKVGIENPDTENEEKPYIEYLKLESKAVVTSGCYQRFYTVNGVNYHHIIDPETLMPGENFMSVSVIADDSGLGDALSTALFLMDIDEGKALVKSIDGVEAMWVLPDGEIVYSDGFQDYTFDYEAEK